jgi:hypothetical protein
LAGATLLPAIDFTGPGDRAKQKAMSSPDHPHGSARNSFCPDLGAVVRRQHAYRELLLGVLDPWMPAGLLYLGSGIGLAVLQRSSSYRLLGR